MNRLEAIASLIRPCKVFADIGCDHGYISLFVARSALAEKIIATDISALSLDKARRVMADYPAEFFVGDGFAPIEKAGYSVDQAVIAGMGGELIIKILSATSLRPAVILGAQKNTDKLRYYLACNGYKITDDVKVEEDGKFYDIIRAEPGYMPQPDQLEAYMGVFYKEKNRHLAAYCTYLENKLKNFKKTEKNLKITRFVQEVKKWQS